MGLVTSQVAALILMSSSAGRALADGLSPPAAGPAALFREGLATRDAIRGRAAIWVDAVTAPVSGALGENTYLKLESIGAELDVRPWHRIVVSAIVGHAYTVFLFDESADGATIEMETAWWLGARATVLVLPEARLTPWVVADVGIGSLSTNTSRDNDSPYSDHRRFHAFDLRTGAAVGKTFFGFLGSYLSLHAFTGSIALGGVSGGNVPPLALGVGLTADLPGGFDVFAEIAPLGEVSVHAGVGWSYPLPPHPRAGRSSDARGSMIDDVPTSSRRDRIPTLRIMRETSVATVETERPRSYAICLFDSPIDARAKRTASRTELRARANPALICGAAFAATPCRAP